MMTMAKKQQTVSPDANLLKYLEKQENEAKERMAHDASGAPAEIPSEVPLPDGPAEGDSPSPEPSPEEPPKKETAAERKQRLKEEERARTAAFLARVESMPDEDIDPQNVKGLRKEPADPAPEVAPPDGVTQPEPSLEGDAGGAGRGRRAGGALRGGRRAKERAEDLSGNFRITISSPYSEFVLMAHALLKRAGARGTKGTVVARMMMRGMKEEYPDTWKQLQPFYKAACGEDQS